MAIDIAATLSQTFGLLFNTLCFCCILFGVTCMQASRYFQICPKDPWYIKTMVVAIVLCSLVQIALLWASVYYYAWFTQGNLIAFLRVKPEMLVQLYFGGLIAFVTQNFYALRIVKLSRTTTASIVYISAALVSLSSIISLGAIYWAITRALIKYTSWLQLAQENSNGTPVLKNLAFTHNVTAAIADTGASLVLIVLLQRSKNGFKETSRLLNRLIFHAINAGLPTTITSLFCVALMQYQSPTLIFVYLFVYFLQVQIYANSLLYALNRRAQTRSGSRLSSRMSTDDFIMSIPRETTRHTAIATHQSNAPNITIVVETITERTDTLKHPHRDLDCISLDVDSSEPKSDERV